MELVSLLVGVLVFLNMLGGQSEVYRSNYMDTRGDTCCDGTNWKLVSFSNKVCEVSPFLDLYQPVKYITVARVSTVWMDPTPSREYLVIGYQFLWFGTMIDHSLINPNQVRSFNIPVCYNTFDETVFGIEAYEAFAPFTSKGAFISLE